MLHNPTNIADSNSAHDLINVKTKKKLKCLLINDK